MNKRVRSLEKMEEILESTYPDINCRIDGNAISIFADFPAGKDGFPIFDYWGTYGYSGNFAAHFLAWVERSGYWAETQNPEHIKLWVL